VDLCFIRGRAASWGKFACLGALWLALLPGAPALAGAYAYPAGQGQVIVTAMFTQAWQEFDTHGRFVPTPRFRQILASAYLEYGLTDRLTAIVKPTVTRSNFASGSNSVTAASTGSQLGARYLLGHWQALSFAMEASAVLPSPKIGRHTALLADGYGGGELRGLSTLSFSIGAWPSFVDLGFGYRWHAGAPPDEWRAEATFGTRPTPKFLVLLQFFGIMSNGSGNLPFTRFQQDKLQASMVYDFTTAWSLQVGGLATLAGVDTPAERGGFAAVWRRF
jgi:hypothetical protein